MPFVSVHLNLRERERREREEREERGERERVRIILRRVGYIQNIVK